MAVRKESHLSLTHGTSAVVNCEWKVGSYTCCPINIIGRLRKAIPSNHKYKQAQRWNSWFIILRNGGLWQHYFDNLIPIHVCDSLVQITWE